MKVFVSYSHHDPDQRSLQFGRSLTRFLLEHGVEVFFDELSLRHGEPLAEQLVSSIYRADKFLLIASSEAFDSNYVQTELKYARDRAVTMHPQAFIHVVSMGGELSLEYLPPDLRASVCHIARDKTSRRLLYEVFLALHGVEVGQLIALQLAHHPGAKWLYLESYRTLDIIGYDGTTRVTAIRAVCNLDKEDGYWSDFASSWATNSTEDREMEVTARSEDGRALQVSRVYEMYRGKRASRAKVEFLEPISPGDVGVYRTEYVWPQAFNLKAGDTYTLDAHERAYGYLRLDLLVPRYGTLTTPRVQVVQPDGSQIEQEMRQIGWNEYTSSFVPSLPGVRYDFVLPKLVAT